MKLKKPKRKIRRSEWSEGDICYWCENIGHGRFEVKWARVDEYFSDAIAVDFLECKENRVVVDLVRNVSAPIDEWKDDRYHKLPKGWTYSTLLYEVQRVPFDDEMDTPIRNLNLAKPDTVQAAYDAGFLVKSSSVFQGVVESEITKEGYRIILKNPMYEHKRVNAWIRPSDARHTVQEAYRDMDLKKHEILRQCSLTDEEWSWEQIDKAIRKYAHIKGYDTKHSEIQSLFDYFRGLDKIEEVEVRLTNSGVQWKRESNKKWRNAPSL